MKYFLLFEIGWQVKNFRVMVIRRLEYNAINGIFYVIR